LEERSSSKDQTYDAELGHRCFMIEQLKQENRQLELDSEALRKIANDERLKSEDCDAKIAAVLAAAETQKQEYEMQIAELNGFVKKLNARIAKETLLLQRVSMREIPG
jgi:chromosome segregation ATPase